MATPNKFSNPDTPGCDCLRLYADCLIIKPLQAIFCLPFVCCARAHKNHEKQREINGAYEGKRGEGTGTVENQPSQQHDMIMLPDASKPRDQWPAEWRSPQAESSVRQARTGDGVVAGKAEDKGDKTAKDKFTNGVLKISSAA